MAFSLNRIELIGNLGRDAETRFTANNLSVTTFSIATTHSYKGKDGNFVNETTWHNCVGFNLSDFYKENLKKGKKFYIEGRLTKRDYTDKDGNKRYSTDVIVNQLIPLESTSGAGGADYNSGNSGSVNEPDVQVDNNDDLPF
jgi:single-strand DNA-binding protein